MRIISKTAIVLVTLLLVISGAKVSHAQTAEQNTAARYLRTGMEQLKAVDYPAARGSFEQSLRYDDTSAAAHLGLGVVFFHLRDDKYAERELTKASELDPRNATAYQVLGELFYRKDDLETAVSYWEKAVELDPDAAGTRARLERIRKEHRTEKDFNREMTSHFLIKYEGREKIEAGRIILGILEDAYGAIGRSLSYYPEHEMQVILYSGEQFREVTDAPGWSGGIYDGKIRIPIGGIEQETPGLRRLLYHEYTHAVVRSITTRCPTWLNEGLAQYFAGDELDNRKKEVLKRAFPAGKLPSLVDLEGSFMGLGNAQAQYAYAFSLSSVRYMVDSFGMYRVKTVLEELGKGADTGNAVSSGILISYEEFERGWKRSLE